MPGIKIIHFIRHCEPHKHAGGYTLDSLTNEGLTHAESIAGEFPKNTILISSPYNRTLETAYKFEKILNSKLIQNYNWREISIGIFTNKLYSQFLKNWEKYGNSFDYTPPDGESVNDGRRRILIGLREFLDLKKDKIICITHASIIANLRMMIEGISFEDAKPKYGENYTLKINKDDFTISNLKLKKSVKIHDLDKYLNSQEHKEV